jgi:hypothetical protein
MTPDHAAPSWQASSSVFLTPAVALILLAAVLGGAELATRVPAVRDALHVPSVGSSSRRFELQLAGVERYVASRGGVDCLVLGNSTALMGVDPDALNRSYRHSMGQPLRCFNFGVDGMTASAAGAIAPILVDRYRPRLLIYVVSARDVGQSVEGPALAADPWVRYQGGTFSLDGWLASHSEAFGYFLLYRQWLDPVRWPAAKSSSGTTATGFFPIDGHRSLSPELWARTQALYDEIARHPLSDPELTGFARLVALSGPSVRVVVIEAPGHQRLRRWVRHAGSFYGDAIAHMRHEARRRQVPFWRAPSQRLIAPDSWVDFVHVDRTGAARFSEWIGARLAAAAHTGRLDLLSHSMPAT